MGYIVAAAMLILAVFFHKRQETWACPEALFCYEWALISFLASLRLFGLYETSWLTWIIILVGSISFVVGCCGGRMIKMVDTNLSYETDAYDKRIISNRMFWTFVAIIIVYTMFDFFQSIHYMRLGISLGDIRNASVGTYSLQGYTRRTGAAWEYIETGIAVMELLSTAYGIAVYIEEVENGYKYILTVMIVALMRAFAYGGRFGLAYVIIELLVCMNLNKVVGSDLFSGLSVTLQRRVKWIASFLILVIVAVTLIRGAETSDLLKKYYRYICGDVVFFDLHVREMPMQSLWSCGFAGFYGFWAFVLPILNGLGIDYPQIYLNTVDQIMDGQTFRKIGDGLYTNAFVTPFYHLYADFRIVGVILGMILFGLIAGAFYKKFLMNRDNYSVACYLILTQMIFKSLQTYPFASKTYVVAFVVIWILGTNIKFTLRRK